jgi:hypothetical protein
MPSVIRRRKTDVSSSIRGSRYSDDSQDSQSTAPTSVYSSPRPSLHQAFTDQPIYERDSFELSPSTTYYPRSSTETYASTNASEEVLYEEPESYDPLYEVPEYKQIFETDLRSSTPQDFADYFPSTKRLHIRHDDTAYDGNMNLRVDAEGGSGPGRKKGNVQLFHLRMHDLKKQEFSLRRYERSSGREVCHSSRKYNNPAAERRPALTRTMSNALASIRGKPEMKRANSGTSISSFKTAKRMERKDSGYGSDNNEPLSKPSKTSDSSVQAFSNTTKLEFSNYAQIDVKRRGAKSSKRYEFEYWGHTYAWKRVTEKDGQGKAISYHLFKGDNGAAVAHIVPEMRSPQQLQAEDAIGSWVPPCSLWISDTSVLEALTDVADVIVATGLIALVDDCIKRRFHSETRHVRQVAVPMTPLRLDIEFVGPKAIVEHMFKRRNSGGSKDQQRKSPLRFASPIDAP